MSEDNLFKLDVDTLKRSNTSKIIYFFKNGYEEFVVRNVKFLSKAQILRLLNFKDEDIDYIKDKLLIKDIAILFSDDKMFFESLPDSKRSLIAYYGYKCYEEKVFGYDRNRYDGNLRLLLSNKFSEFTDELVDKILKFYGVLPSRTIEFMFKKLSVDINYLDQVKNISDKYFGSNINLAIKFHEKYPNLYNKLLNANIDITDLLVESLVSLAINSPLENVDSLRLEDFYNFDINNYNYAVLGNGISSSMVYQGCVDNYDISTILFSYPREVVRIDIDSNVDEYNADVSHLLALIKIYGYSNNSDNKIIEIIYRANLNGDILFLTENAGLVIWLPPTITNNQRDTILGMLSGISDTNDIYIGYALMDKEVEFVMLKDGMNFNKNQAIQEISKLKIDDNCSYLKFNDKSNVK